MQKELKNIFVTKEVAKLAKEKGFNEICAGYFKIHEEDVFPNSIFGRGFILEACDNPEGFIEAPTHYQLIQWLLKNHEIDVWHSFTSIDDALIFSLNLINQNQNGK